MPFDRRPAITLLEPRRHLAVTLGGEGTLSISATGSDDFVQLVTQGSNLNTFINGTSTLTPLASIQRISLDLGDGNDTLAASGAGLAVPITIAGGNGNDTLAFAFDAAPMPVVQAGDGFDQFTITRAAAFSYTIPTGLEKLLVAANTGGVTITGNEEANHVEITTSGAAAVNALGGNDYVKMIGTGSAYAILDGGLGNDILVGTPNADSLRGNDGNDAIYAGDGADKVWGGLGDDFLAGEAGKDLVRGEDGNDRLYGGGHSDKLYGGSGADRLYGQSGNDTLYGESGADYLIGDEGTDSADKRHTDRQIYSVEVFI